MRTSPRRRHGQRGPRGTPEGDEARESVPGLGPRVAAYSVLSAVRAGAPFEAALDRAVEPLGEADRRLAHELAAGVFRSQTVLDERLAPLVPRGWAGVANSLPG